MGNNNHNDTDGTPSQTTGNDKRKQYNDNESRPPVNPDNPNHPAPFDPFTATVEADGGMTVQDDTELVFEHHLQVATITTESTEQPTPTNHTQNPRKNDKSQITRNNKTINNITPSYTNSTDPYRTQNTTLIQTISSIYHDTRNTWEYNIATKSSSTIQHIITRNNTPYAAIKQQDNKFTVGNHDLKTENVEAIIYPSAREAFAALTELIDWGELPKGSETSIWDYTGYNGSKSFIEYISGHDNSQCGDHIFSNTIAQYNIHIESYRTPANTNQDTVAIMTMYLNTGPHSETPIHRSVHNGQKQAFTTLFEMLSNDLSTEIRTFTGRIGDTMTLPSIAELLNK